MRRLKIMTDDVPTVCGNVFDVNDIVDALRAAYLPQQDNYIVCVRKNVLQPLRNTWTYSRMSMVLFQCLFSVLPRGGSSRRTVILTCSWILRHQTHFF